MTQSASNEFPSAISLEALEALQKAADARASQPTSTTDSFQDNVEEVSLQILEDISDKFENHMIPKVLTMRLINQMIGWAQENQNAAAQENDLETFAAFTAMSAQLAAAGMTIQNTYFGSEDFTHPSNNEEGPNKEPAH